MMEENKQLQNKNSKDCQTNQQPNVKPKEIGGPKGPEPTRYGDWERKGRCIDF